MPNFTTFNTSAPYIFLSVYVKSVDNKIHEFDAIFDTGAPATEISDKALHYAGFIGSTEDTDLKDGLQTQKYSRIILPEIQICGHPVEDLNVYISHFEKSWGIDALIGLDFLRKHKVEIDYSRSLIITEKMNLH